MILYIDDQALITKILRDYIRDIGGYEVLYVRDVKSAKDIIAEKGYLIKLILLDIMMPKEVNNIHTDKFGADTGLYLSEWINARYPALPIWAITVRTDISREKFTKVGIEKTFPKPLNPNVLLEEINRRLT